MRSHMTVVENPKTGADMKYELNTWYHYDEAAKKHFERWAPTEAAAAGHLVLACKKWDEETDKFFIRMFFDCYYDSNGSLKHTGRYDPTYDGVVYGKPVAFLLLPPRWQPFEDFMKGVKHA